MTDQVCVFFQIKVNIPTVMVESDTERASSLTNIINPTQVTNERIDTIRRREGDVFRYKKVESASSVSGKRATDELGVGLFGPR